MSIAGLAADEEAAFSENEHLKGALRIARDELEVTPGGGESWTKTRS